ncbi:hypothetical protein CEQ90_09220 [Lewinellaceae bacterium SD302]|nr:hypothetical protein CEQ90_09220 [Lewinellaceae bacterium SD302]
MPESLLTAFAKKQPQFTVKYFVSCLFLLALSAVQAQAIQPPSITVTGEAAYNLSPDEIIVRISYEEYFATPEEDPASKVPIEEIEKLVIASIKDAGVPDDKITMGEARLIRPRVGQRFLRRRINKSLLVCVSNTEEYLRLIRQLESDGVFEQEVTSFDLTEYRHTERQVYEEKCELEALVNARAKAERIASKSGRKIGRVMQVRELDGKPGNPWDASAYQLTTSSQGASGFQGIPVSYTIEVVFELVN